MVRDGHAAAAGCGAGAGGGVIRARYPGKCADCGEPFEEGDVIGQVDGEWCCEDCVQDSGQTGFFENDRRDY